LRKSTGAVEKSALDWNPQGAQENFEEDSAGRSQRSRQNME
jgi:hypothetical protein